MSSSTCISLFDFNCGASILCSPLSATTLRWIIIRCISMDLFQLMYFNGFIFGGRGGYNEPVMAYLGLLSYSSPLSHSFLGPLPNSSKIDGVLIFIRSNMS